MLFIVLNESVCIFAHLEEICFFFGKLNFSTAIGAFAVNKLRFRPEGFTRSAVPTLIGTLIYIALVVKLLEELLNLLFMIVVCSTNKMVVGSIHQIPNVFDGSGNFVNKCFGGA